jgi:hypothetical protein
MANLRMAISTRCCKIGIKKGYSMNKLVTLSMDVRFKGETAHAFTHFYKTPYDVHLSLSSQVLGPKKARLPFGRSVFFDILIYINK